MTNLKVGDKVFAKHKNTRYYKATVVKIQKETFCCLDFDDGSFSDDTFPEDIMVCIPIISEVLYPQQDAPLNDKRIVELFFMKIEFNCLHNFHVYSCYRKLGVEC